ncbi:Ig-like repeat domain protein 1 [Moritella sp. JT01]|uniref:Ig-like domain-containing protein n=1 Tax=Moritella sp. JT01 TaxID=756698 RepID=UPI00079619D2|nr:Ig-like domain-containing protein [Moritella sp. JT01]KXO12943.1 Ig-like repeat domain protein 1 [Moritella sp. JT01]
MIRFTSWLLLFCTLGILTACGGGGSSDGTGEAPKPSDKKTLTSIQVNIKQATTFGLLKPAIAVGLTQSYDAVGYYSDGATQVITDDVTWQVDNEALAVITNGKVEGLKSGLVMITASKGNVFSQEIRLEITDAVPLSINIDLKEHEMLLGQKQDISLTAKLSDNSASRVTDDIVWETSDGIKVDSEGQLVATQAGSANLTASYRGLISSIELVVKPAELRELEVEVKSNEINLPKGLTKTLIVKGFYSNKEFKDLSNAAKLVIDDESIAYLDKQGKLVALKEGRTRLHAEYLSIESPSITVVITAEKLTTLVISADETIINGLNTQIKITGEFTNKKQLSFTGKAKWFVKSTDQLDASRILTVVQGKATAIGQGSVHVWAQVGNVKSESILITVIKARLQTLSLTVDTPNIVPNQMTSYTVIGQYDNGTKKDLTNDSLLRTERDNHNVRLNYRDAKIIGMHPGIATITASRGEIFSDPITMTVTKAKLTKLMVDLGPKLPVASGLNLKLDVYGTYEYDNDDAGESIIHPVTSNVTWHSQDPAIVSVDKQSLVGKLPGTTQVWCSLDGLESQHFDVIVTDAEAQSLRITQEKKTTIAGYSVKYHAFSTYTDNKELEVTDLVKWHSSDIQKAFFTGNTLNTKHAGKVTIRATFGTFTKSASLTISNAKLETIKLNQVQDDIPLGQTYTLSGIGIDSLDNEISIDVNKFNWNTADNSIVTFISDGEIKAMKEGSTEVTVSDKTDSSIKYSMYIQVGPKALKAIQINATSFDLIYGTDMKLGATGIYTDDTSNNISDQVEWSSKSEVITVDKNGIALARTQDDSASSNTTISAKLGDIQNTANFFISNINVIVEKPSVVSITSNTGSAVFSLTPSKALLRMMDFNPLNKANIGRLRAESDHIIYEGQGSHPQFKHFNSKDRSATQFCENLSNAGLDGRHNWKLASVKELLALRSAPSSDKTLKDSDYFSNSTDTNTMVDLNRENDHPVKKNRPNDILGYVSCVSIN